MLMHMVDRRGEFDENMLKREYKRGRLYRFSIDNRDILTTLEVSEEGQLFIDMKDFTKKTLKVKEIAMAEFMKDNFYKPIIDAASRYSAGSGVHESAGGIRLNSLPGDAAIFSGGAANLVSLTQDIQKVLRYYREKLAKKLPPVKDELLVEEINKKFEAAKEELANKRRALEKLVAKGDKKAEEMLRAVMGKEHRLENNYRDELESAISGEMEAGLFITYGTKAELMLLEGSEDLCGPVTVAIGEKINEAARGTDRNSMVRAKLEMMLEEERIRRKNPKVKYPFDVYINSLHRLRIPFELDGDIRKLEHRKTNVDVKHIAQMVANECYGELKKLKSGMPPYSLKALESAVAIYNKGQALSQEAFKAYMKETKGGKLFFTKIVNLKDLTSSIQEEFFFPFEPLEMHFGYEIREGMEFVDIFVKSGEVVFKGFEAKSPTVVFEMLDRDSDFSKAIMEYHFKEWLEEVKSNKGRSGLLA